MIPLVLQLLIVFLVGATLGALINWAVYTFAWNPRPISPWSSVPDGVGPRTKADRLPILGWLGLRREAAIHGAGHWIRPLMLEIGSGVALAALYWWDVIHVGSMAAQAGLPVVVPTTVLLSQFVGHAVLFVLMMAASFIDIDEKIIPDEITVPGTLIGLVLATLLPMSLLPHVAERAAPTAISQPLAGINVPQVVGEFGELLWLEPVTPISPRAWEIGNTFLTGLPALAIGIGCYWLWCFALAPRIWRGRRGAVFALKLIAARVIRSFLQPPLFAIFLLGTLAVSLVWLWGGAAWAGLFTALVGLVGSGGIVWAVRLIGTTALRREAMGFGDVTLMMMVGTFIGWQAGLIAFFLSPPAGILIGISQFVLRRDDEIPYGPFLCLASAAVVVWWSPIWLWAQPMFAMGGLVLAVLFVCLALLGVMLAIWRGIKLMIFGGGVE